MKLDENKNRNLRLLINYFYYNKSIKNNNN